MNILFINNFFVGFVVSEIPRVNLNFLDQDHTGENYKKV